MSQHAPEYPLPDPALMHGIDPLIDTKVIDGPEMPHPSPAQEQTADQIFSQTREADATANLLASGPEPSCSTTCSATPPGTSTGPSPNSKNKKKTKTRKNRR